PRAADEPVEPGRALHHRPRHGDGGGAPAEDAPERAGEMAMVPALGPAVVGLIDLADTLRGVETGEDQATQVLDMDNRESPLRRQRDEAALRHPEQFERLAVA